MMASIILNLMNVLIMIIKKGDELWQEEQREILPKEFIV